MKLYKTHMPVVSIVIPAFNRGSYLNRSINSVLSQTFKKWELVIVDDGSSDDTFQVVDEYIGKYENIRYMKHSNRRTPLAVNSGIQASCGKYITFLGSDDEYKSEHLALRLEYMETNPDADMLHGGVEIIGHPFVKDKNDLSKEIHLSECVIGGTFFGKRDVFFELGGFKDLIYSDDSDFYERAEKKFIIHKVDFPTYIYYRDTPDSICTNIS
ncbi:MAG: glycosyl transferase [Ignavibacteria bacterium RBG_13_36_8]|nr:MAG: glycosyl transferase [Ignavibacteria bacterium RBG_13_36_8]